MKKAIAYYRKSIKPKGDTTEEESIRYQRESIQSYAKAHNIEIIREYNDIGFTGRNVNRPELQIMLNDLKEEKVEIDELLMYSTNRFGRDLLNNINTMIEILEQVEVVNFVSENLRSDSEYFKTLFLILTASAQDEVERIKKRFASAREGKVIYKKEFLGSNLPLGYVKDKRTGKLVAAKSENTADLEIIEEYTFLQYIYIAYAMGMGQREIANNLNNKRTSTPRKKKWNNKSVAYILGNPIYTGVLTGTLESEFNYFVEDANVEPIVDPLMFDFIQYKLSMSKQGRKPRAKYHLPEFIVCENCVVPMVVDQESLICNKCGHVASVREVESEIKRLLIGFLRNNKLPKDELPDMKMLEQQLRFKKEKIEKAIYELKERQDLIESSYSDELAKKDMIDINTSQQNKLKIDHQYTYELLHFIEAHKGKLEMGNFEEYPLIMRVPFITFVNKQEVRFLFHKSLFK
ncbi:hypothetical protein GLW08_10400 [Pontibacillus yanchengensis]|uniref:Uncharacterized protein n=1 Tax=Pontibacillus yanchengensis TaxID=462910 RepID=A0ACC7VHV2_9BACI|nr:recombinase family protein [Pontibacillus yanchengensis]MYL53746.1 hypothetical protein [Pontibacillus yanchengensis]